MQRLFRPPASILAARFAGPKAPGPQNIAVQRVKISKRRNWSRSFLLGTAVVYTCVNLYDTAVFKPLKQYVEREYGSLSASEKKQLEKELEEEEAEPLFVTLPFTTKRIAPPPYKGDDPEWQEFVKISKDKKLQERIRSDLATLARVTVEKHPLVVQRCGNDMKIRRYWLDIDFPSRPPPTFEHSGIAYDFDSGFHWATEPVDSLTVMRLKKILWPSSLAVSTWVFTTSLVKQNIADAAKALGYEPTEPTQPWLPSHPAFQQAKQQGTLPSAKRQTPDGTPDDNSATAVSKTASDRPTTDVESGGKTSFVKDAATAHINGMRQISDGPWREFRKKLAQTWKATRDYPPRGCVVVSGFVEIETPKGFVTVDIWSHWNPKTEKFDSRSLWMVVRRIQMKTQAPARA